MEDYLTERDKGSRGVVSVGRSLVDFAAMAVRQEPCVGDLFSNAMSQEQGNIENVNRLSPSSFEALFPLGYNDFRTKVMKGVPS